MTADEKQQIKDLGNFHHEFQFPEVYRICPKHHDDDDVDDDDDSAEAVTDIDKCSGFLAGFLLIRMWRNFKNTGFSFYQLEPYMPLIQKVKEHQAKKSTFCRWNIICSNNDTHLELPVAKIPCFHKTTSYICPEVHGQAISMVMVKCAMSGHLGDCSRDLRHTRVSQNTLKIVRFLFPHFL